MTNIGTSFLALNTRRLIIDRKAIAAAMLLSFKVNIITANAKFKSWSLWCNVNASIRIARLASITRGIDFALIGLRANYSTLIRILPLPHSQLDANGKATRNSYQF